MPLNTFDLLAMLYMFTVWLGYSTYAKHRASKGMKNSLSHAMRLHRERWVRQMLLRDIRMTDASLLASQERVVGFFASATLIIIAATFTALSSSGAIAEIINQLPFTQHQSSGQVQIKLLLIVVVLVYAFFMITWSLRQNGFAAVMIGGAPVPGEPIEEDRKEAFVHALTRLMDVAGHDNNKGLRAYYFCLAMVFWVIHPYLYMLMSTVTLVVLAQREFSSKAVQALEQSL